jgi:hypothetical protein
LAGKLRKKFVRFDLVTGENTYASQTAQNPRTSRRILGWIPSAAGDLTREAANPKWPVAGVSALAAAVEHIFQFSIRDANGDVTHHTFAYSNSQVFRMKTDDTWTSELPFTNIPSTLVVNNVLRLSDGLKTLVFTDDFAAGGVDEGFPIPLVAPEIDTSQAGTLTISANRFYWTAWADSGATFPVHESSSSLKSVGTGAITSKKVRVRQQPGTVTVSTASTAVTGVGTAFNAQHVGMILRVEGEVSGTIASVTDATNATLVANSLINKTTQPHGIFPIRADRWYIYASETENSGVGYRLAKKLLTEYEHLDESPFVADAGSTFEDIERPTRNDPPPNSKLLTFHKRRVFRRRETSRNFFLFSAYEEVRAGLAGAEEESYPGTDSNTLSDIINEYSYPDQSDEIRAMVSHGDALHIATEDEIMPLYGESYDDFALSQVTSFNVGVAGRFALLSTPYGLALVSYDLKVYLYPSQQPAPKDVEATSSLIEIGASKRDSFALINTTNLLDNPRLIYYKWGTRNWLVFCFEDTSSVYHTWVYDFDTHGWFELTRGVISLAVLEIAEGQRVLVGGAADGFVYVLDDQTGTYTTTDDHPAATFRPALIDFEDASEASVFRYVEFEKSNDDLDVTVKYWLDPVDADNPGEGTEITLSKVAGGIYRGFPHAGGYCRRLLLEFSVPSDANAGALRSVVVAADVAAPLGGAPVESI